MDAGDGQIGKWAPEPFTREWPALSARPRLPAHGDEGEEGGSEPNGGGACSPATEAEQATQRRARARTASQGKRWRGQRTQKRLGGGVVGFGSSGSASNQGSVGNKLAMAMCSWCECLCGVVRAVSRPFESCACVVAVVLQFDLVLGRCEEWLAWHWSRRKNRGVRVKQMAHHGSLGSGQERRTWRRAPCLLKPYTPL
jgi:hypothetical protein